MPIKLCNSDALIIAKKMTEIAIEQHQIVHVKSDSKTSANNVVEYLNTIYDAIHDSKLD